MDTVRLIGHDADRAHAECRDLPRYGRNAEVAFNRLAARHGDRIVVKNWYVMFTPELIAARIACNPECEYVPSPRFSWNA